MHNFHSELTQINGQALLKNSTILQAEGADAATFLQGQFSQNISKLADKEACFAGLSNPKGRLIASAYIYKKSDDIFWLIIPSAMLSETQKQLTKYVMRSKVKFSEAIELTVYGLWNKSLDDLLQFKDSFKLAEHANLFIGISEINNISDLDDEQEWTLQKIQHVIPEISPETQEHFVAQMVNMDVLNGISFNKGCYTGQEVIARMQHLGRIKRRTLLLETKVELAPGEKIQFNGSSIGEVVNSISHSEKFYALAVMQLNKINEVNSDELLEACGLTIYDTPYNLEQQV